jgi:pimeloyl-ACP methyl ester carboxylesterase
MLIHGAWLTPSMWDRFIRRYEDAGMKVVAPPWPAMDRPVHALRHAPDPSLAKLGLRAIVEHYATQIEALPHPPILIGHSLGGLVVQLLLDRGLGSAGVAIASVPPTGVTRHPIALWNAVPVLTAWNGWNRVLRISFARFASAVAQTLRAAEKDYAYDKFVVPAPGRALFEALLGLGGRRSLADPGRPPLLLIAAAEDRIVPAALIRAHYRQQRAAQCVTDFHEFPHRSHWLCNACGWEEVADHALSWAIQHAR